MPPLRLRVDPAPLHAAYTAAAPFPHAVIDGLFDDDVLDAVAACFPRPDEIRWVSFDSATEKKLGYSYREALSEPVRSFLFEMNSAPVLELLETLTGIQGLIPDPYYGGAGLHQIERGGFLKIHADFNVHPKLHLDRRLNLIVYLNRDWQEEYGGHLELWDRDMRRCARKVLPVFNRTVVFSTTDTSYHGHPSPLACPPTTTRRSASLYYYTNGRPPEERSAPHDTIFQKTHPDEW